MRIDTFNRSRGRRRPSSGTCELTGFTLRIGVKVETHHFHDQPTAIIQFGVPAQLDDRSIS